LDEVGLAEAARLGELFAPVPLTAVVCSPLRRARQTAAPIAASTGARVLIDTAFTDRDVGGWSGIPACWRFCSASLDERPHDRPGAGAGWSGVTAAGRPRSWAPAQIPIGLSKVWSDVQPAAIWRAGTSSSAEEITDSTIQPAA
jgi:broad specificity phosphatase PhoE